MKLSHKVLEAIFKKEWKRYQPNPDPAYSNVPFRIDTIDEYYNDNDRAVINHMLAIKGTARDNRDWSLDINQYELIHRAKRWANTLDKIKLSKNYSISSRESWIGGATCGKAEVLDLYEEVIFEVPTCTTELEAVFRACEWILKGLEDEQA